MTTDFLRLLIVGIGAGLLAAVVLSPLQTVTTTPLILAAEVYETGGHDHGEVTAPASGHEHAHGAAEEPGHHEALGRLLGTIAGNAAVATGYGLILAAFVSILLPTAGPAAGLALGAVAFAAVTLLPAVGLPPTLPGVPEAPLEERQIWWLWAALSAVLAAGLVWRGGVWRWIALPLAAAPHVWGAPQLEAVPSELPAELASRFVTASLLCSAVLWLVLGTSVGWLWQRTAAEPRWTKVAAAR